MDGFSPSDTYNCVIGELPSSNFRVIIGLNKRIRGIGDENTTVIIVKIRGSVEGYNYRSVLVDFFHHSLFIGASIVTSTNITII